MARNIHSLYTNTYNFRPKAHTDFKYVPKASLMIALHDYQQNSKSGYQSKTVNNLK